MRKEDPQIRLLLGGLDLEKSEETGKEKVADKKVRTSG